MAQQRWGFAPALFKKIKNLVHKNYLHVINNRLVKRAIEKTILVHVGFILLSLIIDSVLFLIHDDRHNILNAAFVNHLERSPFGVQIPATTDLSR